MGKEAASALRTRLARLARALDDDDFETLPKLLDARCVYEAGRDGVLSGPEAITEVFQRNAEWARAHVQRIEYSHRIDDGVADRIEFIDLLEHNGETLHHELTMHVGFAENGLIDELRLEYAPGEVERLHDFLQTERDPLSG